MPLYEYACETCGSFALFRPMSERNAEAWCPRCQAPATRAITAANLAHLEPHDRIAHQRNERSAHEPKVVSRREWEGAAPRPAPGDRPPSCGRSRRGWMIGH